MKNSCNTKNVQVQKEIRWELLGTRVLDVQVDVGKLDNAINVPFYTGGHATAPQCAWLKSPPQREHVKFES